MKLNVRYRKIWDGSLIVTIIVVNAQDYPQTKIFSTDHDYPATDGFVFGNSYTDTIEFQCETAAEAEKWVARQINSLKLSLEAWRKFLVPEGFNIEI